MPVNSGAGTFERERGGLLAGGQRGGGEDGGEKENESAHVRLLLGEGVFRCG